MRLEITVTGGFGAPGCELMQPVELSVLWAPGATPSGSSLEQALALHWADSTFTVAGRPLVGLRAGTAPLVDGAVIVVWAGVSVGARQPVAPGEVSGNVQGPGAGAMLSAGPSQRSVVVLVVTAGPGAGAVFELHRGSYTLGRGRCRMRISDPSLSRHHCTLLVGSRGITLTSAPGSGSTMIHAAGPEGGPALAASAARKAGPIPVRGEVAFEVGQRLACGSSVLEIRFPPHPAFMPGVGIGRNGVSRVGAGVDPELSAGLLDAAVLNPLEVPHPASATRNKLTLAAAVAVPVIFGVVLAIATGSWFFLSFAAMGALTALVPLMGGSARRKALQRAIEDASSRDTLRRAGTFLDAGSLVLASSSGPAPPGQTPRLAGVAVRLGTATQPAGVCLSPIEHSFSAPAVVFSPVCVPLSPAARVVGPGACVHSLLNFVLMQFDAAGIPVVLLGPPQSLPLAARLLPLTVLATSTASALQALEPLLRDESTGSLTVAGVLLALDTPLDGSLRASPQVPVMHFSTLCLEGPAPLPPGSVALKACGDRIVGTFGGSDFVPDGVMDSVFAAYARRRALTNSWTGQDGAHPALSLNHLGANVLPVPADCSSEAVRRNWNMTAGGPLRPVPLGMTAAGPLSFDFRRDGPHLLLGGTTGSGKSELLRTLVCSLAAAHSPADLQFVFMDFKGGAGLGVLGKLPHSSSLITDLGGQGMDRSLASLRAELHRREAALASAEATDSDEYRTLLLARNCAPEGRSNNAYAMAHLVIVIDEFRVLVDQFPDAMAELMRMAAVGRSLGMHLVMATQRPQGAMNADIRANVTSSICLRVQSVLDSVDVIGTGVAAAINVAAPGRAYLSRAGGAPTEFHGATLRLSPEGAAVLPLVESAVDRLARAASLPPKTEEQASEVTSVVRLIERAWQDAMADVSACGKMVPAPAIVAPDLPALLGLPAISERAAGTAISRGDASSAGHRLNLGLVDVPQGQRLEPLVWNLARHSHLACFGTVPETSRAVALAASQLLASNVQRATSGQEPALLYLLDGDGSLAPFASTPWTGAHLAPWQLRAAAHLVRRLSETVRSDPRQHLVCISDWARWVSALRSSPWHGTEDHLGDLIRFSPSNVAVAIGGGRELLSAVFFPAMPNRMFLAHGSNSESTMLWPRLPRFSPLPGRAAISGPINDFAGYGLGIDTGSAGGAVHVAQLFAHTGGETPGGDSSGSLLAGRSATDSSAPAMPASMEGSTGAQQPTGMLRVQALPSQLSLDEVAAFASKSSTHPVPVRQQNSGHGMELLLGLGGDGLDPVVTFLPPGCVFPVTGGPRSGKTSFIRAMQQLDGASAQLVAERLGNTDVIAGAAMSTVTPAGGILWLDDAQNLSSQQLVAATGYLTAGGSIVAAFPYPGPALSILPLQWGLRTVQQGMVLMPQRAGDGELFGMRLDTAGAEPPGRAVLIERGTLQWLQFPLPRQYP